LNGARYEVIAVTPLTSGAYNAVMKCGWTGNGGVGYGYGYSFTKGVVITARRMGAEPSPAPERGGR
jgi:hypothetical protein